MVVGGGSKYYGHYKMTPPPPPTAEYKMLPSLALFVHLSGLFISFYSMPLIHKSLWLVKEVVVVVVVGGGVKNIMAIIK